MRFLKPTKLGVVSASRLRHDALDLWCTAVTCLYFLSKGSIVVRRECFPILELFAPFEPSASVDGTTWAVDTAVSIAVFRTAGIVSQAFAARQAGPMAGTEKANARSCSQLLSDTGRECDASSRGPVESAAVIWKALPYAASSASHIE